MNKKNNKGIYLEKTEEGIFTVSGQLIFNTVSKLLNKIQFLIDETTQDQLIIIDCSSLSRMDSAGIALLLDWKREASLVGKNIEFRKLPQQAKAIIRAARLSRILAID